MLGPKTVLTILPGMRNGSLREIKRLKCNWSLWLETLIFLPVPLLSQVLEVKDV